TAVSLSSASRPRGDIDGRTAGRSGCVGARRSGRSSAGGALRVGAGTLCRMGTGGVVAGAVSKGLVDLTEGGDELGVPSRERFACGLDAAVSRTWPKGGALGGAGASSEGTTFGWDEGLFDAGAFDSTGSATRGGSDCVCGGGSSVSSTLPITPPYGAG